MLIVRFRAGDATRYGVLEGGTVIEYSGTPWTTFRRGRKRHSLQQVLLLAPDRCGLDPMGQVFVQSCQLLLQPRHVGLNLLLNRVRGPLHPVLFRHKHLNQLASSREQRTEGLHGVIR